MSMISTCIEPGCSTLCIGLFCVAHDARPTVEYPRGRPWPPARVPGASVAAPQVHLPATGPEIASSLIPVSPAA
jgi:hypothetical protein